MNPLRSLSRNILRRSAAGASHSVLIIVSCLWLLGSLSGHAIVDTNNNGLSDLWEKIHNDGNLFPDTFDPQADLDGDGWTNVTEAAAGTDPNDGSPPTGCVRPVVTHFPVVYTTDMNGDLAIDTPEAVTITWPTLVGKQYTLQSSFDLTAGSWLTASEPKIGKGEAIEAGFELDQDEGGSSPRLFLRVAISDYDTDQDNLTDSEEHLLGSSPYFSDTDNDGISDGSEINSGTDPSVDDDGDGEPDNHIYSVVFEIQQESHIMPSSFGFEVLSGADRTARYLTYQNSEEYSVTGSYQFTEITDGNHINTRRFLSNGVPTGIQPVSLVSGVSLATWQFNHQVELGLGEILNVGKRTVSKVGPTISPTEIVTTFTETTPWSIMKDEQVVRSGTETITSTYRQKVSDQVTYPQFWNSHVKPLAWEEQPSKEYGPLNGVENNRSFSGDASAAETIRNYFLKGNFTVDGIISDPGDAPYANKGYDARLKRLSWRWVRFNPSNPFEYEYFAPSENYQKPFQLLVQQTNSQMDRFGSPAIIHHSETLTKAVVQINCASNEGNYWESVDLDVFNPYKIQDPAYMETMDFSKWTYSTVSLRNEPTVVSWKAVDGFDNVETHIDPWTMKANGNKVFPDYKNPDDTEIRHKLEVRIQTSPAYEGKAVFVKAFDVDDSTSEDFDHEESSTTPVIDTNGKSGDDNLNDYLNTPKTGQFWTGSAWGTNKAEGVIDAEGKAKFIFKVGMQPGNNYRVVASLIDEDMYDGVQASNPAAPKYLGPELHQNGSAPASPLLTVWRRLWVENDSMAAIPMDSFGYKRNDLSYDLGSPVILTKLSDGTNTTLGIPTITDQSSFSNLEKGRMIVQSIERNVIGTSTFGNTNLVTVSGDLSNVPLGSGFRLYDDDDFGLDSAPLPRNDLVDSFMKDFFKPSFIEVVDAGTFNPRKFVPFEPNDNLQYFTVVNDSKDLTEKDALWISQLTAAYQFGYADDGDPNDELPVLGGTRVFGNYEHSTVFVESCREEFDSDFRLVADQGVNPQVAAKALVLLKKYITATATHEIGHQPGTDEIGDEDHAEGGLMREGGTDPNNPEEFVFSPKSIHRFRISIKWSKK